MAKAKRVNKTKPQIKAEIDQTLEVQRQRKIVVEKIFPLLLKHSTSIANASQISQVLLMTLRQAYANQMVGKKVKELDIEKQIDPKVPQASVYLELFKLFEDESISMANNLLEGVGNEIQRLLQKEQHERSFDTLKTDFISDVTVPAPLI